ncbi:MAG: hypothetical protein V1799_21580 [bacterium]
MSISILLGVLAVLCALGSVFTGVQIANDLKARGIPANPALVRWMIFKYMAEYRRITLKETGTIGPLYTRCANISALAALFAIAAVLTKVL